MASRQGITEGAPPTASPGNAPPNLQTEEQASTSLDASTTLVATALPTTSAPAEPSAGPAMSPAMRGYFAALHEGAMACYALARKARAQGKDPHPDVEIPPAEDLAARVEAQVGPPGVAELVRRRTKELGNREVVSLHVAQEVAASAFAGGASKESAVDQAVRTGLSILTEGVLVAPLEGIAEVKIGANGDGTDYVDLYFAGPIRAAGGTAQAMAVLIADLVRRKLGIGHYVPTESEIERYKEEIASYKQEAHLQYNPTDAEIERIARNCPVCVNGEGTEQMEVTGNRDLERVATNQLRGGACLVMAEGMILKAPKVLKHVEKLKVEGWDFLKAFIKKEAAADVGADGLPDIPPNKTFMKEVIAGRPVFAQPGRPGGFRLRYGRGRTGGLASTSVHPATMAVLDDFLAVGTQIKVERPGKGTVATPCTTIEGPTVLLKNGSLVRLSTSLQVKEVRTAIHEIVDLGEMLVPFGEFAENNALLPRASWTPEWWRLERAAAGTLPSWAREETPTGRDMVLDARAHAAALHPAATLLWHDVSLDQVRELSDWVLGHGAFDGRHLHLPVEAKHKATLTTLLALHEVTHGEDGARLVVAEHLSYPLVVCLGLDVAPPRRARLAPDGHDPSPMDPSNPSVSSDTNAFRESQVPVSAWRIVDTPRRAVLADPCQPDLDARYPTVDLVSRLAGFAIMPRAPCRIGGRMGRPEKADVRFMKVPVHGLFPLGETGGLQRLLSDALAAGPISVQMGDRACSSCGKKTWRTFCDCGSTTRHVPGPPGAPTTPVTVDLRNEVERARRVAGGQPEGVKLVKGLMSAEKVPEILEKAFLRAKHQVYTFKDGTVRFDMTDVPVTHVRAKEIGTSVARLRALGYLHDMHGEPLERPEQLVELRVQDIVVSESCGDYLARAADYMDDLLERVYGLPRYYCLPPVRGTDFASQDGDAAARRRALVGHLTIALAPHTSGGVLSRIIGYTKAQCHFGHPYFHAAKRRNCDGDEDAVMLLLDGLVNFSRAYVPDRRGGLMDLPLVLSTRLDPNEVDKEAHNVDVLSEYPLAFYHATTRHAAAKEVAKHMGQVESRIGKPEQYEGFGFTHDTPDIAQGPAMSAYKSLGAMMEKMTAQMELARKIRAVDEAEVGARVIGSHLLPDLIGNLKSFSKQSVRCPKCNEKYRRMPLKGVCLNCGNPNLTLTVHEGSVRKYLETCKEIAVRYRIDAYTQQRILLLENAVESLFQNDKVKKAKLSDFF